MGKLSSQEIKKIIARDAPGYRLSSKSIRSQEGTDAAAVDMQGAEATESREKTLREKYLGSDSSAEDNDLEVDTAGHTSAEADAGDDNSEDEIVAVEPERSAHPWDRSARPKAVVISGKEKKIIGSQG